MWLGVREGHGWGQRGYRLVMGMHDGTRGSGCRCLLAMIAEGARIAEEGIALRPSDIDVVMLAGYAFPRWRGGPMKAADLIGLLQVRTELAALAPAAPAIWSPPPILSDLIKHGRRFDDLNGD